MSEIIKELNDYLADVPTGAISETSELERVLAGWWDELEGSSEGGMEGWKLLNRMEQVVWNPPILKFVIERHGGVECGGTRAELQHWEIDVAEGTATITKTGYRQLYSMAARLALKPMAQEIAQRILDGDEDDRLEWAEGGDVRVLAYKVFPTGTGFKRTVEGRRIRLCGYIVDVLADHGWEKIGWNRYRRTTQTTSQ